MVEIKEVSPLRKQYDKQIIEVYLGEKMTQEQYDALCKWQGGGKGKTMKLEKVFIKEEQWNK